ncbi:MAG: Uma2 family endonuclease [Anaerolineae bacterium]|nr:Uma2 family endonuclease [Anaerolineae bacterium]
MSDMTKTKSTFADYVALPESSQIVELIDGEIIVNPPLDVHQDALGILYVFLRQTLKGGKLRMAPTGVYFDDRNSFEPEIFWVSPQNDHCFLGDDNRYWHGAPDLIVEILSSSTASKDRGIKFETYEQTGVREYWLVDPISRYIEIYNNRQGVFMRLGLFEPDKSFVSEVLGNLNIDVNLLFPSLVE